jgi:hypothetical protein
MECAASTTQVKESSGLCAVGISFGQKNADSRWAIPDILFELWSVIDVLFRFYMNILFIAWQILEWNYHNHSRSKCPCFHHPCSVIVLLSKHKTILYKYITQKLYICDPQTQLTTSLLFQNLTTCFGPCGPSSGDIFEDSHSTSTHPSSLQVWGYLLLLNLYVYSAKEV